MFTKLYKVILTIVCIDEILMRAIVSWSVVNYIEQVECRCQTDNEVKLANAPTLSLCYITLHLHWVDSALPKASFETLPWISGDRGKLWELLVSYWVLAAYMKQESKQ